MKLSEAVRLGVPEIHLVNDFWYYFNKQGVVCEGCLVGAALRGACIKKRDYQELTGDNWHVMETIWPWTTLLREDRDIADILTHLCADYLHGERSLDNIVEIIERLEAKHDRRPAKPAEVVEEELVAV